MKKKYVTPICEMVKTITINILSGSKHWNDVGNFDFGDEDDDDREDDDNWDKDWSWGN